MKILIRELPPLQKGPSEYCSEAYYERDFWTGQGHSTPSRERFSAPKGYKPLIWVGNIPYQGALDEIIEIPDTDKKLFRAPYREEFAGRDGYGNHYVITEWQIVIKE